MLSPRVLKKLVNVSQGGNNFTCANVKNYKKKILKKKKRRHLASIDHQLFNTNWKSLLFLGLIYKLPEGFGEVMNPLITPIPIKKKKKWRLFFF